MASKKAAATAPKRSGKGKATPETGIFLGQLRATEAAALEGRVEGLASRIASDRAFHAAKLREKDAEASRWRKQLADLRHALTAKDREAERLAALRQGAELIKHDFKAGGARKPRWLQLSGDGLSLGWGDAKARKTKSSIALKDVVGVCFGPRSDVFTRRSKIEDEPWLCFSVVTPQRTLDLSAWDERTLATWVVGLAAAVRQARERSGAAAGAPQSTRSFRFGAAPLGPENNPGLARLLGEVRGEPPMTVGRLLWLRSAMRVAASAQRQGKTLMQLIEEAFAKRRAELASERQRAAAGSAAPAAAAAGPLRAPAPAAAAGAPGPAAGSSGAPARR
eukprot:tig00000241_g20959.t1